MTAGSRNPAGGVGSLLRNAREVRGLSIDEAARDTKLPADHLTSLEEEAFADLLGDVYLRASLRTYAVYLGIDPNEVAAIYARGAEQPSVSPPPPPRAPADRVVRVLGANRLRDNQRIVLLGAAAILVVAIAFGLLSRGGGSPGSAPLGTTVADPNPSGHPIDLAIEATRDVTVTVTIDGRPQTYSMTTGESRSFTADQELRLQAAEGGSLRVVVDENDLGVPGSTGKPWSHAWVVTDAGGSPSPTA